MRNSSQPRLRHGAFTFAAVVGLSLVGGAQIAHATNGFFSHCIGAYSCGMAGAGVAMPMDASDSSHNPATMARLGNEVVISPAYFHPVRTMDLSRTNPAFGANTAAGKQTSQVEDFIEGAAGVNY